MEGHASSEQLKGLPFKCDLTDGEKAKGHAQTPKLSCCSLTSPIAQQHSIKDTQVTLTPLPWKLIWVSSYSHPVFHLGHNSPRPHPRNFSYQKKNEKADMQLLGLSGVAHRKDFNASEAHQKCAF